MGVNKLLTCDSSELQSFPEMSTVIRISFLHIICSTISFPLVGNDWAKALGKKMKSDKAPAEHKNLRWLGNSATFIAGGMKQGGPSRARGPLIDYTRLSFFEHLPSEIIYHHYIYTVHPIIYIPYATCYQKIVSYIFQVILVIPGRGLYLPQGPTTTASMSPPTHENFATKHGREGEKT